MINRNKLSNLLSSAVNMLVVTICLSAGGSCGTVEILPQIEKKMSEKEKIKQATCPNCDEDYRHLYKVSVDNIDEDQIVILRCHECGTNWDNPEDISLNGATSAAKLERKFKVHDYSELFKEKSKGWVRVAEAIINIQWKQMAENNELLITE